MRRVHVIRPEMVPPNPTAVRAPSVTDTRLVMTMPPFLRILATTALCLAAMGLNSCSYPSVEERGSVLAFAYHQTGGIDNAYYFPENTPYPRELRDWIEYNNGKLYYATMVTYAPGSISLMFPSQQLHFSFRTDIIYDGSNYRNLTQQDKDFLDWLKSLLLVGKQAPDNN